MKAQFIIAFILTLAVSTKSAAQNVDDPQIIDSQFEITIKIHSHIERTKTKIFFSNRFIKVLKNEEVKKTNDDSTIFSVELTNFDTFDFMDKIKSDSLLLYYSNPCVDDGFSLEIFLSKGNTTKHVILDNYYQADVGKITSFIDTKLPVDYRIKYDKDKLVASQKNCDYILLKKKH